MIFLILNQEINQANLTFTGYLMKAAITAAAIAKYVKQY